MSSMKFGIFYEHQIGRPWDDRTEHQLIQDALEQVELADQLGIQYVWEVEHHFLEEYSHSSAPEVFLAAASQRTTNMRLGHGIMLTAPQFNHPARCAERIGMLDLVSNGRVEFGSGESSSEAELGAFGVDPLKKREAWLEGLETTLRCMVETPFTGVDGQFVTMPPRNVVPKPIQKPHPPLWVACSRRDTILLAAEKGIGALTFAFIDPEEARSWVAEYEQTLAERCVPVGYAVNPQVACVSPMMMHHDEDEAIRRGVEGANFFGYSLGHFYVFGKHAPGVTDVWAEYVERRAAQGFDPEAVAQAVREERLGAKVAAGDSTGLRGCIGTPDQVREYLRRYEEAGVDQVIFVLQAGRNQHEHIMDSIELFGREVLPEFVERDAAAVAAKALRMQPVIDAAMARKAAVTTPHDIGDYSFGAIPRQWAEATHDTNIEQWLEKFADDRAAGKRDESAGIAG
ncbi:MAG: flavin-dependent oxidoreductase, F420-dependent methylene-tetrahydromethanopterin reductase [Ilumatobacteraceae bacterium]|nr:flavin-dependent oxidoreductase, F420-dependent methylene-tetrahydromethanopterin reductase [Ilumatobacteraceae bacterium]